MLGEVVPPIAMRAWGFSTSSLITSPSLGRDLGRISKLAQKNKRQQTTHLTTNKEGGGGGDKKKKFFLINHNVIRNQLHCEPKKKKKENVFLFIYLLCKVID